MKLVFAIFLTLFSVGAIFAQSEIIAKIESENITAEDLSAAARESLINQNAEIAALRRAELERETNNLLLAVEAAARKISPARLFEIEVTNKTPAPTAAQIQTVYDSNSQVFAGKTLAEAAPQIKNYLQNENAAKISDNFAAALRRKHKIIAGVDVNSPNFKPSDTLATIGTQKITAQKFNEKMLPREYAVRSETWARAANALDETLYSKLILRAASQQKVEPEDFIKREITDKLIEPTEPEARKFYDERRTQLKNADFETVKYQIFNYLVESKSAELRENLLTRLKKEFNVAVLLEKPVAPVLKIAENNAPSKGAVGAPVTVVMFTDFQCPACARTHPVVTEIMAQNAGKIRLVVKDFPLLDIHPQAFRAAQAAHAAAAQNKFFEFIELLYQNQNALDDAALKKYAAQTGMNAPKFALDLNGGKFDAQIRQSIADGEFYAVRSTPTIYVNGRIVEDISPAGLNAAIQDALKK